MTARGLYSRYLRLLEKWPVDESKKGRDLGEVVRKKIMEAFSPAATSGPSPEVVDQERCEAYLQSLTRIATNYHKGQNRRAKDTSASGLGYAECHSIVSNEFLAYVEKESSISKKVLSSLQFSKDKADS